MDQNMTYVNKPDSKLLKGIVIGGIIGGALALVDTPTRNKAKNTAIDCKNSSTKMISEVKESPGEVKDQMISQFKNASNTLKEAISDAQSLYKRVNEEIFGNMDIVKEVSNDAMLTAKEAKGDLAEMGSKVKDAGSELVENPVSTNDSGGKNENTAYPVERTESAIVISPNVQKNIGNL